MRSGGTQDDMLLERALWMGGSGSDRGMLVIRQRSVGLESAKADFVLL